MQRTTLVMPSSDEVTMTGSWRNWRSFTSCSSTWKPSISGISISSSTRSKPSRRSISSATRPFSADATLWPCSSRLRPSSSRLTLLSSTTSRRAGPLRRLRMTQGGQRRDHARIFLHQGVDRLGPALDHLRYARELQLAGHRTEGERTERVGVGLERMRGAAELVGVRGRERAAQLAQHRWRFLQERVHELQRELGARRLLAGFEGRAIYGR